MQIEATTAPAEVVAQALAISRAAGLDVCGIEFLVDQRDGRPYFYDVNALSNFVTDATRVVGFDPFERLVDAIEAKLRGGLAGPRQRYNRRPVVAGSCVMTLPVAGVVDQSRPRTLLDLVGNTPLLRLRRFERADGRVRLYAKAEWRNPGGSVKDRAAAAMILDGERQGLLTPGKTILDATSGNTGIAYAMMGAARGYAVKLCMPSNVTPERKRILRAYGAELVLTDPMDGSDGAIREVRKLYAEDPAPYYYPDQYSNPVNWRAHYDTTGPELLAQTDGAITHFVAGLGTSGTFMGIGRYFREHAPHVRLDLRAAGNRAARARGPEAHGVGHRPAHLRPGPGRRGRARRHGRRVHAHAAPGD